MFIEINNSAGSGNHRGTVLVFTEGTVLMHRRWYLLLDFRSYVPIGASVEKLKKWASYGYEIFYLTSRRGKAVDAIKSVLEMYGFPGTRLYFRSPNEQYHTIAEEIAPDFLVEDDCRSIGGTSRMTITHVDAGIKPEICSLVVGEFKGIEGLPDDIGKFLHHQN